MGTFAITQTQMSGGDDLHLTAAELKELDKLGEGLAPDALKKEIQKLRTLARTDPGAATRHLKTLKGPGKGKG